MKKIIFWIVIVMIAITGIGTPIAIHKWFTEYKKRKTIENALFWVLDNNDIAVTEDAPDVLFNLKNV